MGLHQFHRSVTGGDIYACRSVGIGIALVHRLFTPSPSSNRCKSFLYQCQ
jgi:hypothetical protein